MARVDRIADGLADQVVADREALQPAGFTPESTARMVLSLPAASMAWKMSSTARRLWA